MASNNIFSYGHGQLIEKGSASTGYNSIMAYGTTGYRRKANYYSNPDVIFPGTGTPTGVAGVSNNARVLREMIGQMAALGDESGTCSYVPPPSTCKERCWEKCRDKKLEDIGIFGHVDIWCLIWCKKKC